MLATGLPKSPAKNQWHASLELDFAHSAHGTQLKSAKRLGPLSVQKAFYPEGPDYAHVYLLHPPAGIVSGDTLSLSTKVGQNARVLLTTPGANRYYRARTDPEIGDPQQTQLVTLQISADAVLEYLPQETIVYPASQAVSSLDVHLNTTSIYFGWEIICLGLPASGQPFVEGSFNQLNRVFLDEELIYHDRIRLNQQNGLLSHPAGLAGQSVFGSFIISAPKQSISAGQRLKLVAEIRARLLHLESEHLVSITDINGLLVARYLGQHGEQCKALFFEIWQLARPVCVDQAATQPRIWFT